MNFSEARFYETYLTSDFHTNTVISRCVCLLFRMASETVIRPITLKLGAYSRGDVTYCSYAASFQNDKDAVGLYE